MRYILLSILLFLFFFKGFSQFIEDDDNIKKDINKYKPVNVIKTNPLAILGSPMPLASEYRVILEHQINKKSTFFVGFSYLGKGILLKSYEESYNSSNSGTPFYYALYGFRAQGGYKFYYNKKAPKGFYVGPFVSYLSAIIKEKGTSFKSEYIKTTYLNTNIVFGHQFIIGDVITIDICSGWGYKNNEFFYYNTQNGSPQNLVDETISSYLSHVKFVFNFNFGYKF